MKSSFNEELLVRRQNRPPPWGVFFDVPTKLSWHYCRPERDFRDDLWSPACYKGRTWGPQSSRRAVEPISIPVSPGSMSTALLYHLGIGLSFLHLLSFFSTQRTPPPTQASFPFLSSYLSFNVKTLRSLPVIYAYLKMVNFRSFAPREGNTSINHPKNLYLALQVHY